MTYPWGDTRRFNSYAGYFRRLFGCRVQKLSVNAGFTCPNRDGTIGEGGCTFCNNGAFTPSYCMPSKSVGQQIAEGIEFHRNRYRSAQRYLVYFQAFSNTYAPLERLKRLYDEALAHPGVAGIVVGTRPDCVDERKLDYFAGLARDRYVALEYGIESTFDATLRAVNRGHDFACARRAVEMTAARGLHVGAHFILGLPGETDAMLLDQVERINALPLTTVKFHQLQVFRATPMAAEYDAAPERFRFWEPEEYIDLFVEILRRLRPGVVVERFASEAPPRYHYGRNWGLVRNEQLLAMLEKRLEERQIFIPLPQTNFGRGDAPRPAAGGPGSASGLRRLCGGKPQNVRRNPSIRHRAKPVTDVLLRHLSLFRWIGCILPTGGGRRRRRSARAVQCALDGGNRTCRSVRWSSSLPAVPCCWSPRWVEFRSQDHLLHHLL